jgi:glycosyltransferase involved in cell wall biosynthesis
VPVSALIVEVNGGGHRFRFVSHLIKLDTTARLLTSREASESTDFDVYLGGAGAQVSLIDDAHKPLQVVRAAFDLAVEHDCEVVVFPDADRYLRSIVWLTLLRRGKGRRVNLLLMRARPADRRASTILKFGTKALVTFFLSHFRTIRIYLLIDAFGVTRPSRYLCGTPLADPIDLTMQAPRSGGDLAEIRITSVPFVLGIFGVITKRKNPGLVLDAAIQHPDVEVMLAGQMDAETRGALVNRTSWVALERAQRLHVLQGYLTTEKLMLAMTTTTAVAILYENNSPSGIMAEAVAAGRPVIVPSGGALEEVVNQLGIGVSTKLTVAALSSAIEQMKGNEAQYDGAVTDAQRLLAWKGFAAAMLAVKSPESA